MKNLYKIKNQKGITLLESLVAIAVAAIGILAIVIVQFRTLAETQTSVRRTQAIRLIDDLGERMRVNPNALRNINNYVIDWGTATGTPARTPQASKLCDAVACKADELASYDIREWKRLVEASLPMGDVNVFLAPAETVAANRRLLGVMIRWRENERQIDDATDSAAYKNQTDFTKTISGSGAAQIITEAGGNVTCNVAGGSDYTCHLQYVPVSARCTADTGSGSTEYYCPGI